MKLEPLTAEAFAPYGDVIDAPALGANAAPALTHIEHATTPRLGFNHVEPWTLPLIATQMERHNRSTQCFIPVDVSRYVIMVAPDVNGAPDPSRARGFIARGDQAVNYHIGTWHHPMRALDRPARFAVLMWTTGNKPDDEEWATLPEAITLE